ncbi:PP2C family protein-serine/threonine phosphatase [Pseudomonas iridis]|uniref:PP2C family protein-serine/threonine phosphatase n=1 Tax=Pseudomonas iridis TaxID=2710587 RepID=A0ABW8DNR0_9PSED
MRYNTRSVVGRTRKANHDYAGAICDGDSGLFVITDGTSRPGSGQLAESFVKGILRAYSKHLDLGSDITEHEAVEQLLGTMLAELHTVLFADQAGTTCYLVGLAAYGKLTLAYEGDCSCGVVTPENIIEWITPPHCKANWRRDRSHRELAQDPARNSVTRCLKVNRAPNPDFIHYPVAVGGRLVFVTDGFWADLSQAQQSSLLAAPDSEFIAPGDDVTWIDVQL